MAAAFRRNPWEALGVDYVDPSWKNLSREALEELRKKKQSEFSKSMENLLPRFGYEAFDTLTWYQHAQPLKWIEDRQLELAKPDQKDEKAPLRAASQPMVAIPAPVIAQQPNNPAPQRGARCFDLRQLVQKLWTRIIGRI
jgi:hypothetical protein